MRILTFLICLTLVSCNGSNRRGTGGGGGDDKGNDFRPDPEELITKEYFDPYEVQAGYDICNVLRDKKAKYKNYFGDHFLFDMAYTDAEGQTFYYTELPLKLNTDMTYTHDVPDWSYPYFERADSAENHINNHSPFKFICQNLFPSPASGDAFKKNTIIVDTENDKKYGIIIDTGDSFRKTITITEILKINPDNGAPYELVQYMDQMQVRITSDEAGVMVRRVRTDYLGGNSYTMLEAKFRRRIPKIPPTDP